MFSLVCLQWWITLGDLKVTKNEAVMYVLYKHTHHSWLILDLMDKKLKILSVCLCFSSSTTGSSHSPPPSRLLKMTQIVTSVVSLLLLCLLRFVLSDISKSCPPTVFVGAGNLAMHQTSYSAPNAIFKPLSLQQIDNGSNLSPNRK